MNISEITTSIINSFSFPVAITLIAIGPFIILFLIFTLILKLKRKSNQLPMPKRYFSRGILVTSIIAEITISIIVWTTTKDITGPIIFLIVSAILLPLIFVLGILEIAYSIRKVSKNSKLSRVILPGNSLFWFVMVAGILFIALEYAIPFIEKLVYH